MKIVNTMYEINIMNFLNIGVIFTTIVFILCKNGWAQRTPVGMTFDISISLALLNKYLFRNKNVKKIELKSEAVVRMVFCKKDVPKSKNCQENICAGDKRV